MDWLGDVIEANFDGLVGPSHTFAGVATGNLAAAENAGRTSNPRAAALQGIAKMRVLVDLGLVQGVLPPQERPAVDVLRRLGFAGTDAQIVEKVAATSPALLYGLSSASAMWVANAGTISAAADTADGRVHITPANLASQLHRSIETEQTARTLKATFPDTERFAHHRPLPSAPELGDEGAANHTRLVAPGRADGVSIFVHGRVAGDSQARSPRRFPARQTYEAAEAVVRQHGLDERRVVHAQQHPDAIDGGVFHNDVIAVGADNVLLVHEDAYLEQDHVLSRIDAALGGALEALIVPGDEVPLEAAVSSYLFNSQLVRRPNGALVLVAPAECRTVPEVAAWVDRNRGAGPIDEIHIVELGQSMRNGGGPACLRLRLPLKPNDLAATNPGSIVSGADLDRLEEWVRMHYRDELTPHDLGDPSLLDECRNALDEVTQILGLGSIYPFQLN